MQTFSPKMHAIPNKAKKAKQKKVEHFPLLLPPGKAEERREILI